MKSHLATALAILALGGSIVCGQSPVPIIVQAITPEAANAPRVVAVQPVPTSGVTLKLLEELKASNAAILSKQAETLQQLDELEKAAEQIRIFSKRG